MSAFFENLWSSIFTPGPTPTLLLATNVSFAALQVLLLALLVATYSIHFVILSGLTAGLWWAINWFAGELRAAQEKEEAAKRIRDARRERGKERTAEGSDGDGGEAMDSGDDTEVDAEEEKKKGKKVKAEKQSAVVAQAESPRKERSPTPLYTEASGGLAAGSTTSGKASLSPHVDNVVRRRSGGESTGDLSTDSEWEKVSEEGSGER